MASEQPSKHAFPGTEKPSASGTTTPDFVTKEENEHNDQQSNEKAEIETAEISPVNNEEYPTGTRLIPILFSLICSVFLVALDMVSIGLIFTAASY